MAKSLIFYLGHWFGSIGSKCTFRADKSKRKHLKTKVSFGRHEKSSELFFLDTCDCLSRVLLLIFWLFGRVDRTRICVWFSVFLNSFSLLHSSHQPDLHVLTFCLKVLRRWLNYEKKRLLTSLYSLDRLKKYVLRAEKNSR